MYEALKQTQNKKFCFVLGLFWICFGLVLRCFVSVVRAASDVDLCRDESFGNRIFKSFP